MTDVAALVLSVCLIAIGATTLLMPMLLWWAWRSARKKEEKMIAAFRTFSKRLASPDFDGIERHLGHALPASFRAMYQDQELILGGDIFVGVPNPLEHTTECYIACFQPADIESLETAWPGCEGLFPIADNGSGDQFLVDLSQTDPEVIYHLHESGQRKGLGVALSAFLNAPRCPASE